MGKAIGLSPGSLVLKKGERGRTYHMSCQVEQTSGVARHGPTRAWPGLNFA